MAEAMLVGKPVVGARSGATFELVRERFNGLLRAPGDFQALAQRLRFLTEADAKARSKVVEYVVYMAGRASPGASFAVR